jgi:tight adherence protein B
MELIGIAVAMVIGLAILLVFVGLRAIIPSDDLADRMYDVVQAGEVADRGGARLESISTKRALAKLNRGLLARGFGAETTANLLQADLKITATEYALLMIGFTLLGALFGYAISRHPVSALVAGVSAFFIMPVIVSWRKVKRRRLFADQLPDALSQLASSLRAGYSVAQGLDMLSKQMPAPSNAEFLRVVREVQLGLSLEAALIHLSERIHSDDLIMVINSINIQQQVGGNLAEILDTVAETIRERVRIKREIQVLTAQQRISGYILVALPIVMAGILLLINPTYEMRLFTPGPTLCIPVGAAIAMVVGYIIMQRIVDIEV